MNKSDGARAFVRFLALMLLFVHLPLPAQAEGATITTGQVNQAVREIQKLCANEIEQGAVPGLPVRHQNPRIEIRRDFSSKRIPG